MNIQIRRRAKTLNQGDGAGVGICLGNTVLLDETGGDQPLDYR